MTDSEQIPIFNYKMLRFMVGVIAIALPIVVIIRAADPLSSISASYYTEARDLFVGLLFIIAAFLFAYNGHSFGQAIASKFAAVAAAFVAYFPTSCNGCDSDACIAAIHYTSAVTLFAILAYFCLGPFRKRAQAKGTDRAKNRGRIYIAMGGLIITSMLVMCIAKLALEPETVENLRIIFLGEAVALVSFGVAWFVAGRGVNFFITDGDPPSLLN